MFSISLSSRLRRIQSRSAPAQNTLPAPVRTITRVLVHRKRLEELGQLDDQLRAERVSHLRPVRMVSVTTGPSSFKPDRAHIRNTPNVVSGTGAQEAASSPWSPAPGVYRGGRSRHRPTAWRRRMVWVALPLVGLQHRRASNALPLGASDSSPWTVVRGTRAACWPPITEMRAFATSRAGRGPNARPHMA